MGSVQSTMQPFKSCRIPLHSPDCHKTTLAFFRDALHTNSANNTLPSHKESSTNTKKCSKTNIIVVCTQNQKFLKQQYFLHTIEFSGQCWGIP